jgi:glycolate oxidase FAD binding subunit
LAALTSVTFKVLPAAETEETVFIPKLDDNTAMTVMSEALQSQSEISAAAHVPSEGTYLRFEGIALSVLARRNRYITSLAQHCEVLTTVQSKKIWQRISNCHAIAHHPSHALWRISVAPSEGARVAAAISQQSDAQYFFDWGGGLLWLSVPIETDVRAHVTSGHAILYAAPETLRQHVGVFPPQQKTVAALTARVKQALDPEAKLNPGRMYRGV